MVPPLKERIRCIAIMGATATGKSSLAMELAGELGGEVVSMDSRQVYRGMDIGTAKATEEDRKRVPHHLIDILDPDRRNSAGRHASLAERAVEQIAARGRVPILVGGTGLYFRALFEGLVSLDADEKELEEVRAGLEGKNTDELYEELRRCDPPRAAELSRRDRLRITRALEIYLLSGVPMSKWLESEHERAAVDPLRIVLTMPRFDLRERIARRTRLMFEAGWIEEVEALLAAGYHTGTPGLQTLGYREIAAALEQGRDPLSTMDDIITKTRRYAKRQETFFRAESEAIRVDAGERGFERRILEKARRHVA